jgi:hypothetical protein
MLYNKIFVFIILKNPSKRGLPGKKGVYPMSDKSLDVSNKYENPLNAYERHLRGKEVFR